MFPVMPPTKLHWVYDDPSGVADRPQRPQAPKAPVRRPVRLVHREA
jgi:hypothetical protein